MPETELPETELPETEGCEEKITLKKYVDEAIPNSVGRHAYWTIGEINFIGKSKPTVESTPTAEEKTKNDYKRVAPEKLTLTGKVSKGLDNVAMAFEDYKSRKEYV